MDTDVKQIIEKIAEKLGTTSEFLYNKLVKQAKINAITTLIQVIFILIIGVVLTIYMIWQINLGMNYFAESEKYLIFYITLGIINSIFVLVYVFTACNIIYYGIDEIIKCWKNPEGWAIDEILNKFQQ